MDTKLIIKIEWQERELLFLSGLFRKRFDYVWLFLKTIRQDSDDWSSMSFLFTRSKAGQLVVALKTLWSVPKITVFLC